nr:Retrovirus-related Pol polyprotein from transposon TNT 1-94 [Ipomoea batatas]
MANDEQSPPPQPQWKALTGLISGTKVSDDPLNGQFDTRLWIIDTGASRHVTGDSTWMTNAKDIFHCHVGLPNGKTVVATQEGSVRLTDKITLNQVLYVPSLSCNLISVSQLNDDMQSSVHFNSYMCAIQDQSREMIGTGVRRDGLYYFKGTDSVQHLTVNGVTTSFDLWHQRMGHPSEKVMKLLPSVGTAARSFNKACEVCFRAKQPREKFPLSNNRASRIFEKIHCDLWGPYRHQSSCGARYFLTIIDDYSRAIWVYLLIDKTEVLKMFLSFVAMIDRQFSQSIKVVQSDNGTEFKCLRDFFSATGILFQTSCVGTPQQNGRVERKHKHILNVARALRFQANLPIYFWGEYVLAATHLINRTPTPLLDNKTPYEILFGSPPSYNTIRVFGCLCFAHNQKAKGDKFASKSRKCIFVGYPFGKKGWKLFDLETKEFFVSRDVKFFEDNFPFPLTDTTTIPHEEFVHEDFSDQNVEMGRGMRNKVPSVWLRDYIINSTAAKSPSSVTPSPQSSSVPRVKGFSAYGQIVDLTLRGWCDFGLGRLFLLLEDPLTGGVLFLAHSPISWKNKENKQTPFSVFFAKDSRNIRIYVAITCELNG